MRVEAGRWSPRATSTRSRRISAVNEPHVQLNDVLNCHVGVGEDRPHVAPHQFRLSGDVGRRVPTPSTPVWPAPNSQRTGPLNSTPLARLAVRAGTFKVLAALAVGHDTGQARASDVGKFI